MQDLPLKVGRVHRIGVDQSESPHTGRREIKRDRRTESTRSDAEYRGCFDSPLSLHSHFWHYQMAGITGQLLAVTSKGAGPLWTDDTLHHDKAVS